MSNLSDRRTGAHLAGLSMALIAAVLYSISTLMIKLLTTHPIVLIAIRCVIEALLYTVSLLAQRINPLRNSANQTYHLIFYVLIGFVNFVLGYWSFTLLPLGDASALVLSAPVYTCFLAWLFLEEHLHCTQILFLGINLIGVICLSQPTQLKHLLFPSTSWPVAIPTDVSITVETDTDNFNETRLIGVLCALSAAITSGVMFVSNRLLQKTPVSVILWWWAFGSAALSIVCSLLFRNYFDIPSIRLPSTSTEYLFVTINVCSAIAAQFLLTLALKKERAGPISVIRSSDIAFAFILQPLFVSSERVLNWIAVAGACFILASVVGIVLQTTKSKPDVRLKSIDTAHVKSLSTHNCAQLHS